MNARKLETFGLGVLVCAWMVYGSHMLGELFVNVDFGEAPAGHGEDAAEAKAPAAAEPEVDFAVLLAAADPAEGGKVFGKCKSCHSIEAGGAHKVGPNLHNVVGADIAAKDGFAYSGVFTGLEGTWSHEALNAFLADPKGYAPGTKMSFAGLRKPVDRANVIAYMRENTEAPPPLPEPEAAAEGTGDSPAAAPPADEAGSGSAPAPQ